jgi:diguanylate cyclase (GGDEF)-like protein
MRLLMSFLIVFLCLCSLDSYSKGLQRQVQLPKTQALEIGSGQIYSIVQDSSGFIWVGTAEGLYRYDGHQLDAFFHDSNFVLAISPDRFGNLWVGTLDGLYFYDKTTQKFSLFKHSLKIDTTESIQYRNSIESLLMDSDDNLWIGAATGLSKINTTTMVLEEFETIGDSQLDLLRGRFNQNIYGAVDLSIVRFNQIVEDDNGNIWLAMGPMGLIKVNRKTGDVKTFAEKTYPNEKSCLGYAAHLVIRGNNLVVGNWHANLCTLDIGSEQFIKNAVLAELTESLKAKVIFDLYVDRNANLWVATDAGLVLIPENDQYYTVIKNSPKSDLSVEGNFRVRMLQDKSGLFWLSKYKSIHKIKENAFNFERYSKKLDTPNKLKGDYSSAIAEDKQGLIWLASKYSLDWLNPITKEVIKLNLGDKLEKSLAKYIKTVLLADSNNMMWIGTKHSGLFRLDIKKGVLTREAYLPKHYNGKVSKGITSIRHGKNQSLWIGTMGSGISRIDLKTSLIVNYSHDSENDNSIIDNRILSSLEDIDGNIWIGSLQDGVNLINVQEDKVTRLPFGGKEAGALNGQAVFDIYEDSNTNLWVSSNEGLSLLTRKEIRNKTYRFKNFESEQEFDNSYVFGVVEDKQGLFWINTENGLYRFNLINESFKKFDEYDGIQNSEFNSAAFLMSPNEQFYFGGINGVTSFNPDDIITNNYLPPTVITDIHVFSPEDKKLLPNDFQQGISIADDVQRIEFTFSTLDYSPSKEKKYQYKLDGFETNWVEIEDSNTASYTELPSGNYTFRVIGLNGDGVWNETGAAIQLEVLPPVWKTTWAFMIYALFVLLFLLLALNILKSRHKALSLNADLLVREQSLEQIAKYDTLTGLPNRLMLAEKLEQAISNADLTNIEFALFFIDLDGFKAINDSFGHATGDALLIAVAKLLKESVRKQDTVARLSGDEFVILMGDIHSDQTITSVAEHIISKFSELTQINQEQIKVSSSIGVAIYPRHTRDKSELLKFADSAMYDAKRNGKNKFVIAVKNSDMA